MLISSSQPPTGKNSLLWKSVLVAKAITHVTVNIFVRAIIGITKLKIYFCIQKIMKVKNTTC